MGRQTRQVSRAQERRQHGKSKPKRVNWSLIAGLAIVVIAVIAFGSQALGKSSTKASADKPIDGITCGQEVVNYHVHSHLTLLDKGKTVNVPTQIGFGPKTGCLYWLHTHSPDGIIHIEAPRSSFHPTLGEFFDVWGEPLSRARASYAVASGGETMKEYVNRKAYAGNPRGIKLGDHTDITIETGPPFKTPRKANFSGAA